MTGLSGQTGQIATLHADRGSVPTGDDVADVLRELGVGRSLSRPHVSDGRVGSWRGGPSGSSLSVSGVSPFVPA